MKTYNVIIKYSDCSKNIVLKADGYFISEFGHLHSYKIPLGTIRILTTTFNKDVWEKVEEVE